MLPSIHDPRYALLRTHLRQLRLASGLTQVELADRLKVDQSYVSKIERGERYMDVLFYLDWCRGCNIEPTEALAGLAAVGA